jgi:hypothetical protein
MTNDEAKAICKHLRVAQQLLGASAPATDSHIMRISAVEDSLNPNKVAYVGDAAAALETLKPIYDDLGLLKAVRPGAALVAEKMPERKAPALLSGVVDAMEQISKAGALLNLLITTRLSV